MLFYNVNFPCEIRELGKLGIANRGVWLFRDSLTHFFTFLQKITKKAIKKVEKTEKTVSKINTKIKHE